jgi:hypothetical protein
MEGDEGLIEKERKRIMTRKNRESGSGLKLEYEKKGPRNGALEFGCGFSGNPLAAIKGEAKREHPCGNSACLIFWMPESLQEQDG